MTRDEARQHGRELLGNRITRLAETTGLAKAIRAVERVTGLRCGCAGRAARLNQWAAGRTDGGKKRGPLT